MQRRIILGGLCLALVFGPTGHAAVDQDLINQAIDRGVAALRAFQGNDGRWPHHNIGATALAGTTLLECGVKKDDPAITRAATAIRAEVPALTHTYSVALCMVFLDTLGDPADVPLIQTLGLRLLAAQLPNGGWGYDCPRVGGEEEFTRSLSTIKRKPDDPVEAQLPPEVLARLRQHPQPAVGAPLVGFNGDNSNTQFATLGLWVARRHNLPVKLALDRIAARFRTTQNPDGGWGYIPNAGLNASTAAMTAAGVFGLAAWHGAESMARDPENKGDVARNLIARDVNLKAGLLALSTAIGHPVGVRREVPRGAVIPAAGGKSYYFLWSVERLCMALGLQTIGGKDWFNWGAEIILANQQPDGSWRGEYHDSGVDTCFALLFLARANLMGDLTRRLKNVLRDPKTVTLKAGGVGGDALTGKPMTNLKPAIEPGNKGEDGKGIARLPSARPHPHDPPATPPVPPVDPKAAPLVDAVLSASGAEREQAVEKLRVGRGVEFTEALAAVILQLQGAEREAARDALADRLSRMKDSTLVRYLGEDPVPEIRRAAALALAIKDSRNHVPELIAALRDRDPTVARAAHAALRELTGNRGLGLDANAWKNWWAARERR
jgi:F0F1-type ATP synthase membrane subunit c/vacuolar-type H+-ATPase subunit K